MRKITRSGFISGLALAVLAGSTVFALPPQASTHAQTVGNNTSGSNTMPPAASQKGAAGKLKACDNRKVAVTNIMNRIDTRTTNQLKLFDTIASRVEAFYTKSGKTVSNYQTLVGDITTAETAAQNDLSTLKDNSTFTCTGDPHGMVTAFQGYLKTAISDMKNVKTAVKNLIVAVAQANGVNVSSSSSSNTSGSTNQGGTQ